MKNRFVVVRHWRSGGHAGVWDYGGYDYKRTFQGTLTVMKLFSVPGCGVEYTILYLSENCIEPSTHS